MKRLIKRTGSEVKAATKPVNPVLNGVCHVADVNAFDFSAYNPDIDYQFDSFEAYKAWMERFYESGC